MQIYLEKLTFILSSLKYNAFYFILYIEATS